MVRVEKPWSRKLIRTKYFLNYSYGVPIVLGEGRRKDGAGHHPFCDGL